MLEKIILKLFDLDIHERTFIALILMADDSMARDFMYLCLRKGGIVETEDQIVHKSDLIVEASLAGLVAVDGKHRSEFLVDLMASLGVEEAVND